MPNQPLHQQPLTGTVPNQSNQSLRPKKSLFLKFLKVIIILIAAIVLVLIIGAVYVFASMGVVKVPVISRLVYRTPRATRQVQSEILDNEKIKKSLKSELSEGRPEAQINITEGNLTYILQNNYLQDLKIKNPQVALINNGSQMEIFGKIDGAETDLLAIFNIGLDADGKFTAKKLTSLKIGNFVVPDYLIGSKYISEKTIKTVSGANLIESVLSDKGSDLTINRMNIGEGKITEYVSLSSEKENSDHSQLNENIIEDKID